jgi:radical SAM superfamily enzyme YgiQ (UPF0313 family)
MSRPQRAVLVGPIQQENLALQYLAASARAAGHEASVVAYSYRRDLEVALRRALQKSPDLIGLGIAFQNNIDDYLSFMRELRVRGYTGHLTCGGHVPTFCHDELLRDVPNLDSVVRHDGEETLVEMLDCLARGEPPRAIAGLVWREGDRIVKGPVRRAPPSLDHLPVPERSPEPYLVGGITVDFLITARGCVGECNYCSIAAYTSEQSRPFRLRRPEAVAAEIGRQYRERGAKVMFVQDDLFVLPSEKKCIERVDAMAAALEREGVSDVVFWVKGRPETITDGVCRALRRLGTIHMFLGVESASAQRLDYLGRTHLPVHNQTAIERCRSHDIVPSFNFMLFDPDCTLDDIAATLDMADRHLDLPWNVCRTEVYSGTALRGRLEREGRLEGDYRSYGYVMRDERAEVMFRILRVSLHERALEIESLLNRLISLSFSRQLHQHFFPGEASDALGASIIELGIAVRRDTVNELRRALAFVQSHDVRDEVSVRHFAVEQAFAINARDRAWRKQSEELWAHLNLRGVHLMERRGFKRGALAKSGWGIAAGS